jgi:CDP-diacylglycerol--serine O-phosphatidyltransferase
MSMSRTRPAPIDDLHISHALTYVSLACGIGAMAGARPGAPHVAGACLALAALADTFDGRYARLFARTERQAAAGGAIDSLVDVCVFGIAPVAVLTAIAPPVSALETLLWWTAAFVYVLAAVTRLAFFNVEDDRTSFVGVPTPAIALLWSSALLSVPSALFVTVFYLVTGAAMVAPVVIPRPRPLVLSLFAGWAVLLLVIHALKT